MTPEEYKDRVRRYRNQHYQPSWRERDRQRKISFCLWAMAILIGTLAVMGMVSMGWLDRWLGSVG
jgi:hypothetical protein